MRSFLHLLYIDFNKARLIKITFLFIKIVIKKCSNDHVAIKLMFLSRQDRASAVVVGERGLTPHISTPV